jgi:hypothetical protein
MIKINTGLSHLAILTNEHNLLYTVLNTYITMATIHEHRHITKYADQWCLECDEGLCSECENKVHKISKVTRNHGIISIENYYKWPPSIFCCRFFVILSILYLMSVKLCSMLSINVDVLDVLIISRIDKCIRPTNLLR